MAKPWEDDPESEMYKGIPIVPEEIGDAISDFGLGHYIDPDKTYSRPEYAARAGRKILGTNYLLLVRMELSNGKIGWQVIATNADTNQMFEELDQK